MVLFSVKRIFFIVILDKNPLTRNIIILTAYHRSERVNINLEYFIISIMEHYNFDLHIITTLKELI